MWNKRNYANSRNLYRLTWLNCSRRITLFIITEYVHTLDFGYNDLPTWVWVWKKSGTKASDGQILCGSDRNGVANYKGVTFSFVPMNEFYLACNACLSIEHPKHSHWWFWHWKMKRAATGVCICPVDWSISRAEALGRQSLVQCLWPLFLYPTAAP